MSFKENAFPIKPGMTNLTSGTRTGSKTYWCVADGTLTVIWDDASTDDIVLIVGDAVNFNDRLTSVEIASGKFHVA